MSDTPPVYTQLTSDEITANAAVLTTVMRDAICAAHFSANNGAVSTADCYSFADLALVATDYTNVITGYLTAGNVAQPVAAGQTPSAASVTLYTAVKGNQSQIVQQSFAGPINQP